MVTIAHHRGLLRTVEGLRGGAVPGDGGSGLHLRW